VEEAPQCADAGGDAAFLLQLCLHLVKADVRGGVDQLQEKGRMRIELGALRLTLPASVDFARSSAAHPQNGS
jgi:hypothetical protein